MFSWLVSLNFLGVYHHLHYIILAYSLSEVEHSTRLLKKLFNEKYARDLIPRCNDEIVLAKVGIALRGLLDVVSFILFILRKHKCYYIFLSSIKQVFTNGTPIENLHNFKFSARPIDLEMVYELNVKF